MTLIPDDCLLVIKAPESDHEILFHTFRSVAGLLKQRGISGVIIPDNVALECLSDEDLAELDLMRLDKPRKATRSEKGLRREPL